MVDKLSLHKLSSNTESFHMYAAWSVKTQDEAEYGDASKAQL